MLLAFGLLLLGAGASAGGASGDYLNGPSGGGLAAISAAVAQIAIGLLMVFGSRIASFLALIALAIQAVLLAMAWLVLTVLFALPVGETTFWASHPFNPVAMLGSVSAAAGGVVVYGLAFRGIVNDRFPANKVASDPSPAV